jgi:putative ABC transport system permease protein
VLNRKFKILHLLAGILTMIAMFSINLRIMGQPNTPLLGGNTVLMPLRSLGLELSLLKVLFAGAVVLVFGGLLSWFLLSNAGLAMRATGANPRMARANGIDVDYNIYLGLALSNGLIALGGALFAQLAGFADVQMGAGTILIGLAAVILGEALFRRRISLHRRVARLPPGDRLGTELAVARPAVVRPASRYGCSGCSSVHCLHRAPQFKLGPMAQNGP